MKKLILFFTIFLLFGFLSAEEVKNDSSEPQLSDESTQKTAPDTGLKQVEIDDDFFHFQPTAGIGFGLLSMLRLNTNLDFYFNVKHTPYNNIYLGFGTGVYYAPMWENFLEIPVYGNIVIDFATGRSKVLKSVSLRIEAGCLTLYWQAHKSILGFDVKDTLFYWYIFGISADLLFKQDFVLRIGFENGELIIPTLSVAIGYRF
jgi:hypothetical protein